MVDKLSQIKQILKGIIALLIFLPILAFGGPQVALQKVQFTPLPNNQVRMTLQLNAPYHEQARTFLTKSPVRLILDLPNLDNQLTKDDQLQSVNSGVISKFRAIEAGGRTRIVLSLQQVVNFRMSAEGNSLSVTLEGGRVSSENRSHERFPIPSAMLRHSIRNINFTAGSGQIGKLVFDLSDGGVSTDIRKLNNGYSVNFVNTRLPKNLEYRLNVKAFGTPVQFVETTSNGNTARAVLNMKGGFEAFSYQVDKSFIVEIRPVAQAQASDGKLTEKVYKGKRISLNFQDIKVRQILQLISDVAKINIVVSDSVQGNMTIRLNQVPWDQALDIILRTRGLAYRQYGSVLMVAPAPEVSAQEKADLVSKKEIDDLAPLTSELLQVNYAKASEIAGLLKDKGNSLLSTRGNVSVDERTNTLWIQDVTAKIAEVRQLVLQLDRPVRQVLIEARIVLVSKNFSRDLGVRFGVTNPEHVSGTLSGANQLQQGVLPANTTNISDRLNVNLPAATGSASIGIALAKLAHGTLLDLELSALESEGKGEVISTPRVITANKQTAVIESGKEVPYQEATSSGATSVAFKKAVLSLNVTPQITPDNRVLLDLKVNQDTVDTANEASAAGVPSIITKAINTHVLVDNGQTLVLGGIYQRTNTNSIERVPFLGRMPVFGPLFRHRVNSDAQEELLIFVTPKIIHQAEADEEQQ